MKTYLQNIVPQLKNFSLSLDKAAILINKPWAFIDDEGEVQKLIFKKNKELILSKNGKVTEGKWDYFPEAKSLLINRGTDKILCNEVFIDEGVLIMKLDGTNNQFFVLSNENIVSNLDVIGYLNSLRRKKLDLYPRTLSDGRVLEIYYNYNASRYGRGSQVSIDAEPINDGKYKLAKSNEYIVVEKNAILKILTEVKYTNPDGKDIYIQQHGDNKAKEGDYVFIDGVQVQDETVNFSKSKNLIVFNGEIVRFEKNKSIAKTILYGIIVLIIIVVAIAAVLSF